MPTGEGSADQSVRRSAEWRLNDKFTLVLKTLNIIEAATSDDADGGRGKCGVLGVEHAESVLEGECVSTAKG